MRHPGRVTEDAKPKQGTDKVQLGLILLFVGWLATLPVAALQGLFATQEAAMFGFIVVLVPLAGLVIAGIDKRKVASIVFGLAFLLTLSAIGYGVASTYRHPPNPPNDHSVCQEHSGSDNVCPGD